MHREPIPVAFGASVAAATVLAMRPELHTADWAPIVVGSALTAAATGIVASTMQFLKQKSFAVFTVVASAAIWLLVSVLVSAVSYDWFSPASRRMSLAWPIGAATALILSRTSGMSAPRLRLWRLRRNAAGRHESQ